MESEVALLQILQGFEPQTAQLLGAPEVILGESELVADSEVALLQSLQGFGPQTAQLLGAPEVILGESEACEARRQRAV